MSKQAKRKRRPRQPHVLYGLLVVLGLFGVALLVSGVGLLIYMIGQGSLLGIFQALILLVAVSIPIVYSTMIRDLIKTQHARIQAYDAKQAHIPHIQAWRAALLDPTLQPDAGTLVELDMDEIAAKEDFWDLSLQEVDRIRELNLKLYRDPREGGSRWLGQLNTVDPTDSWWWYSEHPYKQGRWRGVRHEFADAHGKPAMPLPDPGKKIVYLLSSLLFETRGSEEANLATIRASLPSRTDAWLRHFIQTFGHANTVIIEHMPERVRWDEVHQVLYHYAAWQAANDAAELPQELALRMIGLGVLMDRFKPEDLLRQEATHDEEV